MTTKRDRTKYQGVYQRPLSGQKNDIVFDITFRLDGRKVWEKVGKASEGYSAKLAAEIRGERIRSKRHGEELPQQKKKTIHFKELAKKYLKWAESNKNRKGIEDKSRYENHLKDRFDDKRLDEITSFDIERLKAEMSKATSNHGKTVAPKTISHCLALLRAMYNKAVDWNLYQGDNPVKNVKKPTVQNARNRFLSMKEVDLLLVSLKRNHHIKDKCVELEDPKLHDMALISLHTGARAGEIFNLKGADVDLQNDLLVFRDTKNKETRYAPMTEAVKNVLKKRVPDDLSAYVFTGRDGKKITEVSNAFQRVVDDMGLNKGVTDPRQRVVFHTLRHTFASWLAIQGTPIYTIAKLMGHKSISMSERYAHLSPDHKKEAIKNLEAGLKKQRKVFNIDRVK